MKKSLQKAIVSLMVICLMVVFVLPQNAFSASEEGDAAQMSLSGTEQGADGSGSDESTPQVADEAEAGKTPEQSDESNAGEANTDESRIDEADTGESRVDEAGADESSTGEENGGESRTDEPVGEETSSQQEDSEDSKAGQGMVPVMRSRVVSQVPEYSYTIHSILQDAGVYEGESSITVTQGATNFEIIYFKNTGSTSLWIKVDGTMEHLTASMDSTPVKVAPGAEKTLTITADKTSSIPAGSYNESLTLHIYTADPGSGAAEVANQPLTFHLTVEDLSCVPMWKTTSQVELNFRSGSAGTIYYLVKEADEPAPSEQEILQGGTAAVNAGSKVKALAEVGSQGAKKVYMLLQNNGANGSIHSADLVAYGEVLYVYSHDNWIPTRFFKNTTMNEEDQDSVDGMGFCINMTIPVDLDDWKIVPYNRIDYTVDNMSVEAGTRNQTFSEDTLKKIECVLYAGYRESVDSIEYYSATQAAIWKYTNPGSSDEKRLEKLLGYFGSSNAAAARKATYDLYYKIVRYAEENYSYFDPSKYGMKTFIYKNLYGGQDMILCADMDLPKSLEDTETYGSLTIHKVNNEGQALAGVLFELDLIMGADGSKTVLDPQLVTDENGTITLSTTDEIFKDHLPEVGETISLVLVETKVPDDCVVFNTETALTLKTVKFVDDNGVPTTHYGIYGPDDTMDMQVVNILKSTVQVDIPVSKVWADGASGTSAVIELVRNGESTGITRTLSEQNGWKDVFMNLPAYDENGKEISYSVVEKTNDYLWSVAPDGRGGYIVTNRNKPANTTVPKTGDTSASAAYLAVLLLACAAAVGLMKSRRKA